MKMDGKKYPNLKRYRNHVDTGPGGGYPLIVDWEQLALEEEEYELECAIEEARLDKEKEEAKNLAMAERQQRIERLRQEAPDSISFNQSQQQQEEEQADGLTKRQREVADLLAQGKNDEEIAGALVISSSTAKTHRQHVAERWAVSQSLGELQREAERRGYGRVRQSTPE